MASEREWSMDLRRLNRAPVVIPALVLGLAACSGGDTPLSPDGGGNATELVSVVPAGGSTNVDPNGPVTVEFDHPMHTGMETYADLHEGDINGPTVKGTWVWSGDYTTLTFTPMQPLKPATTYVIHLGGGMMDAENDPVDFEHYGPGMGGEWATGDMMSSGSGGMMNGGHMGDGWQDDDGTYGMTFTFSTSG